MFAANSKTPTLVIFTGFAVNSVTTQCVRLVTPGQQCPSPAVLQHIATKHHAPPVKIEDVDCFSPTDEELRA